MSKIFTPSSDQVEALEQIQEWAKESFNEVFLLTGKGGTGKTNLTQLITKEISGIHLCATTNQASEVLAERTGLECQTFHSAVYRPKFHHIYGDIVSFAQGDKSRIQSETTRWLKARGKTQNDIPVENVEYVPNIFYALNIDVMQAYEDGGLFISFEPNDDAEYSTLLIDEASMLTQEQVCDAKKVARRVLLVGDFNQLPPVGQEDEEIEYDHRAELTIRHRTGGGSDLDALADWILDGNDIRSFQPDPNLKQVFMGHGFPSWALRTPEVPVITFTNKIRKLVNDFRGANHPEGMLKPIKFRSSYQGFVKGTPGQQLSCGDIMASGRVLSNKDRQRFHMEGASTRFGAEIAYAYSMTCHSAQGSEWEAVILDLDCIDLLRFVSRDKKNPELFIRRWLYTAVSRARKAIILASGIKGSIERKEV